MRENLELLRRALESRDARYSSDFLVAVIHCLTLEVRDLLSRGFPSASEIELIGGINELTHLLSAHARHLINGRIERYPDEVFIDIIDERAGKCGGTDRLDRAIRLASQTIAIHSKEV